MFVFRFLLLGLLVLTGCAARTSQFQIVDYRKLGDPQRYTETFPEAYYAIDPHGNVDIVMRRDASRSSSMPGIIQVIHVKTVWRSIPGRTIAHSTQINGTVSYMIVSGARGVTFEGAGSVFFRSDKTDETIHGTLDLAVLSPKGRMAASTDLFQHAELSGAFVAKRDPRRVNRIIHEMKRRFGPQSPS